MSDGFTAEHCEVSGVFSDEIDKKRWWIVNLRRIVRGLRRTPRINLQLAIQSLATWAHVAEIDIPLDLRDLADSVEIQGLAVGGRAFDGHARVGWLVVPPGPGSGGHTTLFRMMRAASEAGFENTLLFYNRYRADLRYYSQVVRESWPWLRCEIEEVGETIDGFDACVASSWATAHVLAKRATSRVSRLYFIQDYEPYFYARGDIYTFAEDTYRFGFRNIALGEMVHATLERELAVKSDLVPFGADTTTFRLSSGASRRSGIIFYARSGTDRRGYRLAVLALQRFHERHPEQPIHVYGTSATDLPFPVVDHGIVTPAELSDLYNSVIAGVSLSFTNVSLAPEEMLAAGAVPVVNEHADVRAVLSNPHVVWAPPTPLGISDALSEVVSYGDVPGRASAAARSVEQRSWEPAERAVVEILKDELGKV